MNGYIAFYRGTSFISRAIKWFTWGNFSHVSYIFDDDRVIEAWHKGGVVERQSFHESHKPGTRVERYKVKDMTHVQEVEFIDKLRKEVGKKYDFRGIVGFIRRADTHDFLKWFCSELIMQKLKDVGIDLLCRVKAYQVSPSELNQSPLLDLVDIVIVKDPKSQGDSK